MVDKTPAQITPGTANRGSTVHASDKGQGDLSRGHTEEDISRLQSAINTYQATLTYNIGDIIKEQSLFFRCITAITVPELFTLAKWELLSNEVGIFMCSYNTTNGSPDNFFPVNGAASVNTGTEADVQAPVPDPILLGDYTLYVNVNTRVESAEFAIRINSVDGNGLITVGGGLTGLFQDLSNTDTLAAGDLICYQYRELVNITGAASLLGASVQFVRAP